MKFQFTQSYTEEPVLKNQNRIFFSVFVLTENGQKSLGTLLFSMETSKLSCVLNSGGLIVFRAIILYVGKLVTVPKCPAPLCNPEQLLKVSLTLDIMMLACFQANLPISLAQNALLFPLITVSGWLSRGDRTPLLHVLCQGSSSLCQTQRNENRIRPIPQSWHLSVVCYHERKEEG